MIGVLLAATIVVGQPPVGLHRVVPPVTPPTANIVVWGGCEIVRNRQWKHGQPLFFRMTTVEVTNESPFAVGLGTRVTYPDVHDDGTLSEIGFAEYEIYAPGNRKSWSSEVPHTHLTVRYRPFEGNEGDDILELDVDAVCP